jgi:hypothetical protein
VVLPTEAERARHYNGTMTVAELLAIGESPSKRVLLGAQNAREDLENGRQHPRPRHPKTHLKALVRLRGRSFAKTRESR